MNINSLRELNWDQLDKELLNFRPAKIKHRICKECGSNYPRGDGTKKFCSVMCSLKTKKISKCKPKCQLGTLASRMVTFKNNTKHLQQFCNLCRRTRYISQNKPKDKSTKKPHSARANFLKKEYGCSFYTNREWVELRYKAIKLYGRVCACCRTSVGEMHVDHIKPKSKHPDLALTLSNLQILCKDCNLGKGNTDSIQWRENAPSIQAPQQR